MAKQTFTTGQVLTAAQMTSLQQTAMGGGSATAKTASYVLVAADAGTTVAMNAAGSTTITVNTGLFAAGDTVFIQNLGAGACTVTAGTATVATAGSLILPQNDAGILYFTATGASIFYDYIQAGAVSPLTTKGDIYTFSTSDARLAVGTNGQVLTADSSEATGLKFATPSSGGMTLLTTTTLSGASTTSATFSSAFTQLVMYLQNVITNTGTQSNIRFNGDTGSNYAYRRYDTTSSVTLGSGNDTKLILFNTTAATGKNAGHSIITLMRPSDSNTVFVQQNTLENSSAQFWLAAGVYDGAAAITNVTFIADGGTFSSGTVYIYGVN